ncbi:hypothetical protein I302_101316 [Kwoniella bestiolae CBS 10118]|uniref:BRCT domain-containing protein n=1 Tax=Kwoniella bestiolae CBS 10118 TaxID=1296100 RepID=A0AAJ8M5A8_9TREE
MTTLESPFASLSSCVPSGSSSSSNQLAGASRPILRPRRSPYHTSSRPYRPSVHNSSSIHGRPCLSTGKRKASDFPFLLSGKKSKIIDLSSPQTIGHAGTYPVPTLPVCENGNDEIVTSGQNLERRVSISSFLIEQEPKGSSTPTSSALQYGGRVESAPTVEVQNVQGLKRHKKKSINLANDPASSLAAGHSLSISLARPTWRTRPSPISSPSRTCTFEEEVDELSEDVVVKEEKPEIIESVRISENDILTSQAITQDIPPSSAPEGAESTSISSHDDDQERPHGPSTSTLAVGIIPQVTDRRSRTDLDLSSASATAGLSLKAVRNADVTNDEMFCRSGLSSERPSATLYTKDQLSPRNKHAAKFCCVEIPTMCHSRLSTYQKMRRACEKKSPTTTSSNLLDPTPSHVTTRNAPVRFRDIPSSPSRSNLDLPLDDLFGPDTRTYRQAHENGRNTGNKRKRVEEEEPLKRTRKKATPQMERLEVKVEPIEEDLSPQEMLKRGRAENFDQSWLSTTAKATSRKVKKQIEMERCRLLVRGHYEILKNTPSSYLRGCVILMSFSDFPSKMYKTARRFVKVIGLAGGIVTSDRQDFATGTNAKCPVRIQVSPDRLVEVKQEPGTRHIYHMDLFQCVKWLDRRSLNPSAPTDHAVDTIPRRPPVNDRASAVAPVKHKKSRDAARRPIPSDQFYGTSTKRSNAAASRAELRSGRRRQVVMSTSAARASSASRVSSVNQQDTPLRKLARLFKHARAKKVKREWLTAPESDRLLAAREAGNRAVEELYNDLRAEWYKAAFVELGNWTGETNVLRRHAIFRVKRSKLSCLDKDPTICKIINTAGGLTTQDHPRGSGKHRFALVKGTSISQEDRVLAVQEEFLAKTELQFLDYLFDRYLKSEVFPEELARLF